MKSTTVENSFRWFRAQMRANALCWRRYRQGKRRAEVLAKAKTWRDASLEFQQNWQQPMDIEEAVRITPMIAVDFPFEVLGFFEEFIDVETAKFLGIRYQDKADRPLGAAGRREEVHTVPFTVLKGYKRVPVIMKASKDQPKRVWTMLQAVCGDRKR